MNSASGENWKEPSSSTLSTEASFNDDSNEEILNKKILLAIKENKLDKKYIQILPGPVERALKSTGEGFYY